MACLYRIMDGLKPSAPASPSILTRIHDTVGWDSPGKFRLPSDVSAHQHQPADTGRPSTATAHQLYIKPAEQVSQYGKLGKLHGGFAEPPLNRRSKPCAHMDSDTAKTAAAKPLAAGISTYVNLRTSGHSCLWPNKHLPTINITLIQGVHRLPMHYCNRTDESSFRLL